MQAWMKWAIALAVGFAIIATGFRLSWGGTWILRPFFVVNCLVLVIVVLLQSGKAADHNVYGLRLRYGCAHR